VAAARLLRAGLRHYLDPARFALFAVAAALVRLGGARWPDVARLASSEHANAARLGDLLFVGTVAYGIGEEPGWRGFALPRLEARHGPLGATLILIPLWALWHWPAFLYRPAYQGGAPAVVGFLFGLLAGAIVLTFLYDGTRGSILLVALWHILINIIADRGGDVAADPRRHERARRHRGPGDRRILDG
jgi:membrane protease YdiL (CAAX protease family)